MTRITMKAADTLHISSLGPDSIVAGETFDVSETDAKSLESRGLAVRTGETADAAPEKAAQAPIASLSKKGK